MNDGYLSTISKAQTSLLVYSALSAYGSRRGGELPGTWFLMALAPVGHSPAAVRQALFRMEREGEIESRRIGRQKLYRLSAFGQASVAAGAEKLLAPPPGAWDQQWTICCCRFSQRQRVHRDRVRDLLEVEGFARLSRGVWVHLRDKRERLLAALAQGRRPLDVTVFRGARTGPESDKALVQRLWDLGRLAARYRRFLARHRKPARHVPPAEAFARRFAMVLEYLPIAWDDPELPPSLMPPRFPGGRARALARRLYAEFLPGTLSYGDEVLARTSGRNLSETPS